MDLLNIDGKLRFGQSNSVWIYIKNYSILKCLFRFNKRSTREKMILKLISQGNKQLRDDFNFKAYMQQKCQQEHDQSKLIKIGLLKHKKTLVRSINIHSD